MKVRIIDKPTIAPFWIGKIGEATPLQNSHLYFRQDCYNVKINEDNMKITLLLYADEFERVE